MPPWLELPAPRTLPLRRQVNQVHCMSEWLLKAETALQRLLSAANGKPTSGKRRHADVHLGGRRRYGCQLFDVQRTPVSGPL